MESAPLLSSHTFVLIQFVQYKPTGCTIYFQFISVINLYMSQAGLPLIIRRYYSVYTAICTCHEFRVAGCWQDTVNS